MVFVYIRRRKKILYFYTRRRRGFELQEPSSLLSSNGISSLKEEVQNKGVLNSVNDPIDIGFSEGLPAPFISEQNQENSKVEESDATVAKRELVEKFVLSTGGSLHEDETTANMPGLTNNKPLLSVIQQLPTIVCLRRKLRSARKYTSSDSWRRLSGLISKEPLLNVIEQLPSTKCLKRRPRSARKYTFASRRHSTVECSASDKSKQMDSHLGTSTSVCYEISPKTPFKEDKISKFTPHSYLYDVQGLLSTGVLAGAFVKYRKDNVELQGILSTSGICCGCPLCNFEQVVSSLKFEKHAGSKSLNQNDHIFLENGKSLYALSKELKNVSLGSLGKVMEEKFGYPADKAVHEAWKGNPMMHHNNQKHFPDLLRDLQAILNFPKGPRSTRAVRLPLGLISKGNQVSRQLIFCDVDLLNNPAHKKRGVDIKSSKELYLKESSEITSADSYQSKIGYISQKSKPHHILTCMNNAKLSSNYTPDRPLSTISWFLTSGLLERLLVNHKKDKIEPHRCIKDLGISCGYPSRRLNKVLSMIFEKHDELIQKMISCQPINIRFLAWKDSIHKNEINLQSTNCDDGKNQTAHILLHSRPSAERLMLSASENSVPWPPRNDVKVNFSRQTEKTMKHREQDFHQQIFELLNDGTKLSYYSHGKKLLEGYKFGKSILCSCCNSLLSASKFESHAGHEKRRKPYHSIYTTYGKSLHQIAMFLLLDKSPFDLSNKDLIMMGKVGGEQSSSACSPFSFRFGRIFQAPCNLCRCMLCGAVECFMLAVYGFMEYAMSRQGPSHLILGYVAINVLKSVLIC